MTRYYRFKVEDTKLGSILIPIQITEQEYAKIPPEHQLGNQQQLKKYVNGIGSAWPKNGKCELDTSRK